MSAREDAAGKWRAILPQLGIPAGHLDGKHHACPNGGGKDRFRFADRNGSGNYFCSCSQGEKGGVGLVMCCTGLSFIEAARAVEALAGSSDAAPIKPPRDPLPALLRIQGRLRPVGFPVRRYLQERGLQPAPALRQACLTYWGKDRTKARPFDCMVAKIVGPDGSPRSFHVTYLDGVAKAPVDAPRKVMTPVGTITGAAIRLYPVAPHLGIAEGIETAIAAHLLTGLAVWAAVTAGGIESFDPPAGVERVTIFADHDASYTGQAAAFACAKRLAGRGIECDVRMPDAGDWNDVLLRGVA